MKEAEMFQVPVRRAITKVSLLLLITLGAGSCGGGVQSLNVNPHVHPPKTAKKTRLVPCDTTINADINTGGVDLDAAFLCENDSVTWQIPANQNPDKHTFHVKFDNGSPFVGGKSDFTEKDASGTVKNQYDKLEVYKYSITVDTKKPVDPQVIGGGNP
jgi:hypothetical protein